jgi:hypothetical protein
MPDRDRVLGTWELVPELCLYEGRRQPAEGRYVIAAAGEGALSLTVRWRMTDEDDWHEASFGGPCDGSSQAAPPLPAAVPGAPDRFTLTRVDAGTLDSATFVGGVEIASARRVASADAELLAVVQEARMPAGSRVRNFQVYRRVR